MNEKQKCKIDSLSAMLSTNHGAVDEVIFECEKFVASMPNDPWPFLQIGRIFASHSFEKEACRWYERGFAHDLDAFPQDEVLHFYLSYGSILRNIGRLRESENVLLSAQAKWPRSSALQFFLALALMGQGRPMDTIVALAELQGGDWDDSIKKYHQFVGSCLSNELRPTAQKPMTSAARLITANVEDSVAWYQRAFGVSPCLQEPNFALFRWGCSHLEIVRADEKNPVSSGGTIAYWHVSSLASWMEQFQRLGAALYRGPLEIPSEGIIICQMMDPFGSVFGLKSSL